MNLSTIYPEYAAFEAETPRQPRHDNIHTETKLATHEAVRTPTKPRLRCPVCIEEKTFYCADALRRHYRVLHPRQEIPHYPLLVADPGNVSRGSSRPYVCSTCQRRFRQHAHLERHRNSHESCLSTERGDEWGNQSYTKDQSPGQLPGEQFVPTLGDLSSKKLSTDHNPLGFQVLERRQAVEEPVHPCMFRGCKNLIPFSSPGGLVRHEREIHGGTATDTINCPFRSCEWHKNNGFLEPSFLDEHVRRYHVDPGSMDFARDEAVEPVPLGDFHVPSRPSSRASMSSLGSIDSGISHPPTSRRRRKKVVSLSSSAVESWQRPELEDKSNPFKSPSKTPASSILDHPEVKNLIRIANEENKNDLIKMTDPRVARTDGFLEQALPGMQGFDKDVGIGLHLDPDHPPAIEKQDSPRTVLLCPDCHQRFSQSAALQDHMSMEHTGAYYWSCKALPNSAAKSSTMNSVFNATALAGHFYDVCLLCGGPYRCFDLSCRVSSHRCRREHMGWAHSSRRCDPSERFYSSIGFREHLQQEHAALLEPPIVPLEAGLPDLLDLCEAKSPGSGHVELS